jgi:TnpA family transposase
MAKTEKGAPIIAWPSPQFGWVTAPLLISRLQAWPRQNALTKALQQYGRVVKTLFVLRYLESEGSRTLEGSKPASFL